MSVLVFFALAFLTCVVFLVVYKVYKHERLCPDGSILKVKPALPPPPPTPALCPVTSQHLRGWHPPLSRLRVPVLSSPGLASLKSQQESPAREERPGLSLGTGGFGLGVAHVREAGRLPR